MDLFSGSGLFTYKHLAIGLIIVLLLSLRRLGVGFPRKRR